MQLKCCASRTRSRIVAQIAGAAAALHVVDIGRPGDQREVDRVAAEMDGACRIARRQPVGRGASSSAPRRPGRDRAAHSASHGRPWRPPSRTAPARAGSSPRCRNFPGCAATPRGSPRPGRPTAAPSADRDCARAAAAVAGSPPRFVNAPGRRCACVCLRSCPHQNVEARRWLSGMRQHRACFSLGGTLRRPAYQSKRPGASFSRYDDGRSSSALRPFSAAANVEAA